MILTPPATHGIQAVNPLCVLSPAACLAQTAGGAAVHAVSASVFDAFSSWLSNGASWLVGQVFTIVMGSDAPGSTNPVSVNLTFGWFEQKDSLMLAIAVLLLSPLLLAATIGAVLRQDLGRLARTWLVGVPVAFVLGTTSVAITDLGIHVCDELCHMILGKTGPDTAKFFTHLAVAPTGGTIPTVVTALLSVLLLIGAVLLWLEMLMRATAIYVAAFFLPLALAGLVWPATSRMMKRLAEVLVALVFSKFVVVATLALGMGAASSSRGVGSAVTGGAIMLLAAFAPVILLRLVPVVEVAAIDHMAHLGRRSVMAGWRGANEVVASPRSALVGAIRTRFGQGAPGGDGGDGPAAGAPRIADRKPDFMPGSGPTGRGATDGNPGEAGSAARPGGQPPGRGPSGSGGASAASGTSSEAAAAGTGLAGAVASAGLKAATAVGRGAAAPLPAMTEPPRREPEPGDGR